MKRTIILLIIGGWCGAALATWLGPHMVSYWYTPPVQNSFNCKNEVDWAMQRLVQIQIGASIAVGLVLMVVGTLIARARSKRKELVAAAALGNGRPSPGPGPGPGPAV